MPLNGATGRVGTCEVVFSFGRLQEDRLRRLSCRALMDCDGKGRKNPSRTDCSCRVGVATRRGSRREIRVAALRQGAVSAVPAPRTCGGKDSRSLLTVSVPVARGSVRGESGEHKGSRNFLRSPYVTSAPSGASQATFKAVRQHVRPSSPVRVVGRTVELNEICVALVAKARTA